MSIRSCCLPLPPPKQRPDSVFPGLDWSGLMLSCSPPARARSTQSLPEPPGSDPAVSHAALQITAISPAAHCSHTKVFLWPGIIFHSSQDWDRRDNSTLPKKIWLERCTTTLNMINLFLQEPVRMSQSFIFSSWGSLLYFVRDCFEQIGLQHWLLDWSDKDIILLYFKWGTEFELKYTVKHKWWIVVQGISNLKGKVVCRIKFQLAVSCTAHVTVYCCLLINILAEW